MGSSCDTGRFSSFEVGVFLYHIAPEFILPLRQVLVADDLLGVEPAIRGAGDKAKVHVGSLLVHMHHGGNTYYFGFLILLS